jgi:hypothetical protein
VVLNVVENLEIEWMTQEAVAAPEQYVLQLQVPQKSPTARIHRKRALQPEHAANEPYNQNMSPAKEPCKQHTRPTKEPS